jgi:hypothetical protein
MRKTAKVGGEGCQLSEPIARRLNLYAVAAGAAGVSVLALAAPSDAEVIVTVVNQTIGHNQRYAIDMNNDGTTDFIIRNSFEADTFSGRLAYFRDPTRVLAAADAEVWTSGLMDAGFAAALPAGREIGAGKKWKISPALLESTWGGFSEGQYDLGNWFRTQNHFLGLQFRISGQLHYGWARLSVQNQGLGSMQVTIASFAYETEPNKTIRAGQTGGDPAESGEAISAPAVPEAALNNLGVLALGATGSRFAR